MYQCWISQNKTTEFKHTPRRFFIELEPKFLPIQARESNIINGAHPTPTRLCSHSKREIFFSFLSYLCILPPTKYITARQDTQCAEYIIHPFCWTNTFQSNSFESSERHSRVRAGWLGRARVCVRTQVQVHNVNKKSRFYCVLWNLLCGKNRQTSATPI